MVRVCDKQGEKGVAPVWAEHSEARDCLLLVDLADSSSSASSSSGGSGGGGAQPLKRKRFFGEQVPAIELGRVDNLVRAAGHGAALQVELVARTQSSSRGGSGDGGAIAAGCRRHRDGDRKLAAAVVDGPQVGEREALAAAAEGRSKERRRVGLCGDEGRVRVADRHKLERCCHAHRPQVAGGRGTAWQGAAGEEEGRE